MNKLGISQEYIFFDLDGTLTDSQEGILTSLKKGLESVGISKTDDELRVFIGPPLYEIYRKGFHLSNEDTEKAIREFRNYYSTKGLFENRLYDGIKDVLESAKSAGKRLVVATSKPEDFAIRILEHFEVAEYFDFICGSSMDESRTDKAEVIRYALKKCGFSISDEAEGAGDGSCGEQDLSVSGTAYSREVLMVGDRYTDVKGAADFGIKTCYVLFGYGNKEEAEKSGAEYVVGTVKELGDFLVGANDE